MIMFMLPTLMAQEKAIRGYDPVAYFTDGAAVSGQDSISLTLNGKKWCFSSTAHREMFSKSPKAYAPQFCGAHTPSETTICTKPILKPGRSWMTGCI